MPKKVIIPFVFSLLVIGCNQLEQNVVQTDTMKDKVEKHEEIVEPGLEEKEQQSTPNLEGEMTIHFIDVGQGDATLLMGSNFTVLIDAGRHDQNDVVPYLKKVGIETIDLLVGTHPHADHIGQMDKVIESFIVKEVWMSGDPHTTKTFERVINAIMDHDVDYYEPRAGEQFTIGSLHIHVVNPLQLTGDFHEGSISLVATYGDISILFTGDAERQTEEAILKRNEPIQAHIFQLGHHGSSTSNTENFVKAVNPEVAIYSAGIDNSYGHPHREVIDLFQRLKIPVFGTAQNGTIIITSDGNTFNVDAQIPTKVNENSVKKPAATPTQQLKTCIDINAASIDELQKIAHLGEERAQQLIDLRPFKTVDDLTKINGIGQGRLKDIKEEGLACVN